MSQIRRQRSLFWPILLIGIGVIWLLASTNILPTVSVTGLFRMWPLALIFIGLNLLVGRSSAIASVIIGLLAVATLVAVLLASPKINPLSAPQPAFEVINEPLNQAKEATIRLNLGSYPVAIHQVKNPNNIFEGDIGVYGTVNFLATGVDNRKISLSHSSSPDTWFNNPFSRIPLRWDMGLNAVIPTDLTIDGASGSVDLDLQGVNLTALNIDVGSGSFNMSLPTNEEEYTAMIDGGSGSLQVEIYDNKNLTLKINGASGSINIDLPANGAVRIESLDSGSGSLSIPSGYKVIQKSSNGDEGIWQSANYSNDTNRILIQIVDLGSGSISIH